MAGQHTTRIHPSTIVVGTQLVKSRPLTPKGDFSYPRSSREGGEMTRERLEGLPMTVLLDLSRKENLSVDPEISPEELVEELLEAYDEDRRERENLQNLILKIEQTKFESLPPHPASPSFTQEPVLPASYDDNTVNLVLRDPSWALVLWEVRKKDLDTWSQSSSFRGLALRVLEFASPSTECLTFFPIPITESSGSRYLHLPTPGRWYLLELHAQTDHDSKMLSKSRMLLAPPELPDDPKDRPGLTDAQVRLLEVSGSALCETVKEKSEAVALGYPHRIGGWDDTVFQEVVE